MRYAYYAAGVNYKKSHDARVKIYNARTYQTARERCSKTDIVIGKSSVEVYTYSPDKREPPCESKHYHSLTELFEDRIAGFVDHVMPMQLALQRTASKLQKHGRFNALDHVDSYKDDNMKVRRRLNQLRHRIRNDRLIPIASKLLLAPSP